MAYGVFRRHPAYYRKPRPRIYTMPRSATPFILPDPSIVDANGNRKHFYFFDHDNALMRIRTKAAGDFIKLGGNTSASGGYIQSTSNGATAHVVALNDTTWGVEYTGTWNVV
jgi:hypothetical protein